MRVLMLGWEFPPFISGGLGTACFGLTKAMSAQGTEVLFVLPKAVEKNFTSHVKLISPEVQGQVYPEVRVNGAGNIVTSGQGRAGTPGTDQILYSPDGVKITEMDNVTFKTIASPMTNPYARPETEEEMQVRRQQVLRHVAGQPVGTIHHPGTAPTEAGGESGGGGGGGQPGAAAAAPSVTGGADYDGDLMTQVQRYRNMALALTKGEQFDVIHAHDWMTYPAGLLIARVTGKPLVVHVHSTEFDRAGDNIHTQIYEIERRGMHGAIRCICVSQLTKNIIGLRYGVPAEKADVVYNGIEMGDSAWEPKATIKKGDKIVLFLGRITMQKGPEYFVAAAKRVLEKFDKVKFVMAGSGDMITRVIELASEMGIGHKVLFTGFLRGKDVERVFSMADVYVMPSVSEPFGIAPLEAIRHDVPVIISKNSGVAEVLSHALKVDFWDVDEMANKIIAVLRHPPLSNTLREHADLEVRRLTWEGAAIRCVDSYKQAIEAVKGRTGPVRKAVR